MPIVVTGYDGSMTLTNFSALVVLGTNQPGLSTAAGPYWGLRWAGHYEVELDALHAAGKLVWDRGPMGYEPSLFHTYGATHVGYPRSGAVFVVR